jgi:hypothetical protein
MLIVTMITFALLRMIPGNVAVAVMGTNAYRDPGAIRIFDADYGFNLPRYRQYFWVTGDRDREPARRHRLRGARPPGQVRVGMSPACRHAAVA